MKKVLTVLLGVIVYIGLFTLSSHAATSSVPAEVTKVASDGLTVFKERAFQAPLRWGFTDENEVSQMSLGEAFQIHIIDSEKVKKGKSEKLLELSHTNNEWLFLININEQPRSFLTVGIENGSYHLISYGGKAKEFGDALKTFKASVRNNEIKPTVVKDKNVHYLVTNIAGEELNVPDSSADNKMKQTDGMDNSKLWSSSRTVKLLRDQQANSTFVDDAGVGNEETGKLQWQVPTLLLCLGLVGSTMFIVNRRRTS